MKTRRTSPFRPSGAFALEDRVVLSVATGFDAAAPAQVQVAAQQAGDDGFRFPTELPDTSALVQELVGRVDRAFVTYADQYRELRTRYFEGLGGEAGDAGLPDAARRAILEQTVALRGRVIDLVGEADGSAGRLSDYLAARINQLGSELASLPAVQDGAISPVEYAAMGEQAINDALGAVHQFVGLYDAARYQTAAGIFGGTLRFFRGGARPAEALPQLSAAANQVNTDLNGGFSAFIGDLRQSRDAFLAANDADFNAYRQGLSNRLEQLRGAVIDAINRPAGGAGVLQVAVTNQFTQLQRSLSELTEPGTDGIGPIGYAALTEQIVGRSLNDLKAEVQLYDVSLFTTALDFFNANPRFRGVGAAPGSGAAAGGANAATPTGAGAPGQGSGVGTARQFAGGLPGFGFGGGNIGPSFGLGGGNFGLPAGGGVGAGFGRITPGLGGSTFNPATGVGLGTIGGIGTTGGFFGNFPTGFNRTAGFGGLGNGFTFSPAAGLGNGFGFGASGFPGFGSLGLNFGRTAGFGTGAGNFGLGNGFGVLAGPGFGTGVGFGGFFL